TTYQDIGACRQAAVAHLYEVRERDLRSTDESDRTTVERRRFPAREGDALLIKRNHEIRAIREYVTKYAEGQRQEEQRHRDVPSAALGVPGDDDQHDRERGDRQVHRDLGSEHPSRTAERASDGT